MSMWKYKDVDGEREWLVPHTQNNIRSSEHDTWI